jgi:apoptosis-resistant E3 ubiquitin protein ligase 1
MLVVSVSVAGLVTLGKFEYLIDFYSFRITFYTFYLFTAAMTQPSLAPEARHSLLQYVTGKYLLPANCRVEWHFDDPSIVGSTMSFTVRFYQKNGNPYPISDIDNFFVEVTTDGNKKVVAISELGSSDPNVANEAKVKFTTRLAGQYKISIMVCNVQIPGSPFTKNFLPSSMSPHKSRMVRPSSIVVCQEGLPSVLYIEPRDEFGNICNYESNDDPTKGYTLEIYDLHDQISEKFNSAMRMNYDKVNQRINVIAIFPEPLAIRVRICYEGTLIPNANFDLVVLSSCDNTIVHKNIASRKHNICYDAKLLSVAGQQQKSKPRKVLCIIGPKQFTIKEMILKIIPKRVATFRLCPSTKVSE